MNPDSPTITRSWASIVETYEQSGSSNPAVAALAALSRHVRDSDLSVALFGWTSVLDLCIIQRPEGWPPLAPYLVIEPLHDGNLEFRYLDTLERQKQWHRTVPAADAVVQLERFLKQLHWVVRSPSVNSS